jgi:branched-subunit amino acid transport protein
MMITVTVIIMIIIIWGPRYAGVKFNSHLTILFALYVPKTILSRHSVSLSRINH